MTMTVPRSHPGEITLLLRLEGAAVAATGLYVYAQSGAGWWLFAALILVPDLSMLGYLRNPAFGARCYNAAHTYVAPALAWTVLYLLRVDLAGPLALIWVIHLAADRLLGYGLKYPDAFKHTHLTG